jgi:hypothetical protein
VRNPCEIAIVGAGPLAFFACLKWLEQGVVPTLVFPRREALSLAYSQAFMGAFWPSPNDPPTRPLVAHGLEVTRYLIDLHRRGTELLSKPEIAKLLPSLQSEAFRYGLEGFEEKELLQAFEQDLGLKEPLSSTSRHALFPEESRARLLKDPGHWRVPFLQYFRQKGVPIIDEKVLSLQEDSKGVELLFARKESLRCEVVLLATGESTGTLLPELSASLVPMSDMLFRWRIQSPKAPKSRVALDSSKAADPLAMRGHNGHVAIVWNPEAFEFPLCLSGPRFLIPGAGVGVSKHSLVEERLKQKGLEFHRAKTLPFLAQTLGYTTWESFSQQMRLQFEGACYGSDCLPCDELPLVGEFGKWGRIVGSAGFLAAGHSAQLYMAHALVELINTGKSPGLHPRLSPRRLHEA